MAYHLSSSSEHTFAITEASPVLLRLFGFVVASPPRPRKRVPLNVKASFSFANVNNNSSIKAKATGVKNKSYKSFDLIEDPKLVIWHPCHCGAIEGSHDGFVRVRMKQVFNELQSNENVDHPIKCQFGNFVVGTVKFSVKPEDDHKSSQKKSGFRRWLRRMLSKACPCTNPCTKKAVGTA